jgi:hypothetical protein
MDAVYMDPLIASLYNVQFNYLVLVHRVSGSLPISRIGAVYVAARYWACPSQEIEWPNFTIRSQGTKVRLLIAVIYGSIHHAGLVAERDVDSRLPDW